MTDPGLDPTHVSAFEQRLLDAAKHEQIPHELKLSMGMALHAPIAGSDAISGRGGLGLLGSKPALWTLLSVVVLGAALGGRHWLASPKPVAAAKPARMVTASAPEPNAPRPIVAANSGEHPSPSDAPATSITRVRTQSSLRDEIASLDRISAALKQKSANQALVLLQQHTRRFTHGQLVPEAEALHIEALLLRGDSVHADAEATRFLQMYPDHPLTQRVRTLIASRAVAAMR